MTPILTENSFDVITPGPKQSLAIGEFLGALLRPGDVVCLQGDLGSGKTCLTQGIGLGMHVGGRITSPTFVFINEYASVRNGPYLYHVDLYRIRDSVDALNLGLEDYMYGDGVTVIEWAERAKEIIAQEHLWITLTYLSYTKRRLLFEAEGDHYQAVVRALRERLYGAKRSGPESPPGESCY